MKKTTQFFLRLLLCCFILISFCKAQVIVNISQPPASNFYLKSGFSITLNNTFSNNNICNISIGVSKPGGVKIYSVNITNYNLSPGTYMVNTAGYNGTLNSSDNSISIEKPMPDGEYIVCATVTSVVDNSEIGSQCLSFILSTPPESNDTLNKNSSGRKIPIKISGYSEVSGNYASRSGTGQTLPQNYTNIIVNPTIDIYGIPIDGKFLYSTAADKRLQNMNMFNLSFNSERFKQNIETKLQQRLGQKLSLENANASELKKSVSEAEKLKKILDHPIIKKELAQLKQLDSIENILLDSVNYLSKDKKKSLEHFRDSLAPVKTKREGYDNLLKKLAGLEEENSIQSISREQLLQMDDSLKNLENKIQNSHTSFTENDAAQLEKYKEQILKDSSLNKQRKEMLNKQVDRLEKMKKEKDENEELKEKYLKLHNLRNKAVKIDSLNIFKSDSLKDLSRGNMLSNAKKAAGFNTVLYSWLTSVKTFSIGVAYPRINDIVLSGTPVKGVTAEIEKGKWYGLLSVGNTQRATDGLISVDGTKAYQRNVWIGGLGFGKNTGSNIRVYALQYRDKDNSITFPDSLKEYFAPFVNHVLATSVKLVNKKQTVIFESDLAGSETSKIQRSELEQQQNVSTTNNSWIQHIFSQKSPGITSQLGIAYRVSFTANLFKNNTVINISTRKTGTGYQSFGVPFLLKDMIFYEGRITQNFWKRRIILSGFVRYSQDNLEQVKAFTTQSNNFGADLTIRVPRRPVVRVSYTPVIQQNESAIYNFNLLSVSISHSYRIRKVVVFNTSLVGTRQTTSGNTYTSNFSTLGSTFNQFIQFNLRNILQLSFTYNNQQYTSTTQLQRPGEIYMVSASGTKLFFKGKWGNQFGYNYLFSANEKRNGYFLESTFNYTQKISFKIRGEKSIYNNLMYSVLNPSYNEFVLRFSLITRW